MKATLTILGCGNSTGVPAIGNYWGACDPKEPKNKRMRSSILLQTKTTNIVVDTGPDFREQLNRENIQTIDAILYSHTHSDHINGIDELRVIRHRKKALVPIYGNTITIVELKKRFNYLFKGGNHELYPAIIDPIEIIDDNYGKAHRVGDIDFTPFEMDHGTCKSVGYRFGDTAYCVDVWNIEQSAINTLKGIKTLVIDVAGYRMTHNKVHASLDTIYRLNKEIKATEIYLTSLTLSMDYQTLLNLYTFL